VAPLLSDYTFQIAYGPNDDRVNEFYVPALSRSVRYDRSAGFFSSSALAVAATGVARLIANGGKMRLLVGAQLSEADVNALQGGMELAAVVAARMASDLDKMIDAIAGERLAAVAWMIEHDSLEVRVVLPKGKDGHPLPASMCHDYYHPKTGIFTDAEGNRVVFTGSINESEQAWLHNYEMFSVYCSWAPGLLGYITTHAGYFERLWNDQEDGWIGLSIPEAVRRQPATRRRRERNLNSLSSPKMEARRPPIGGKGSYFNSFVTLRTYRTAVCLAKYHPPFGSGLTRHSLSTRSWALTHRGTCCAMK
jgi:hypothetical protein